MPWKFDPFNEELMWVASVVITEGVGDINMGTIDSDISIDLGSREDSPSQIDQGMRVIDGDF
jgi:hypothetical protein